MLQVVDLLAVGMYRIRLGWADVWSVSLGERENQQILHAGRIQ